MDNRGKRPECYSFVLQRYAHYGCADHINRLTTQNMMLRHMALFHRKYAWSFFLWRIIIGAERGLANDVGEARRILNNLNLHWGNSVWERKKSYHPWSKKNQRNTNYV